MFLRPLGKTGKAHYLHCDNAANNGSEVGAKDRLQALNSEITVNALAREVDVEILAAPPLTES